MKVKCKCGKSFNTYLSRLKVGRGLYCSKEYIYIYRRKTLDNPSWIKPGQHLSRETEIKKGQRLSPNTEFKSGIVYQWTGHNIGRTPWNKGKKYPEFSGENSSSWRGGKSFEDYPREFDDDLKKEIRKRDNYTCRISGITEEEHLLLYGEVLSVHHIDYDKTNNKEENLISLSRESHTRTNHNRRYWKKFLSDKLRSTYAY